MKRRHVLASMGAFSAGGSLVISSGAFSSAEANREANIDIVGDPEAYLGLVYPSEDGESEPQEVVVESGERENLFKATNQVTAEIEEFNLEILEGEDAFDRIELHEKDTEDCIQPAEETFGVGDCAQIEIELECSEEVKGTIELEIRAKGEGEHFDIMGVRTWDSLVECIGFAIEKVIFRGGGGDNSSNAGQGSSSSGSTGSGNVHIYPVDENTTESITVTPWTVEDGKAVKQDEQTLSLSGNKFNLDGTDGKYIAVYIEEVDKTYFDQNFECSGEDIITPTGQGSNEPTPNVREGWVDLTDEDELDDCFGLDD